MKIILLQADDNLGGIGDIVNVKAGYARNYLIPNKKASIASKENIAYFSKWIESQKLKEAKSRADIELFAKQLDKMTLKFQLKAGENDKLFGSVTNIMIAEAIAEKGYTIDRKEIEMEETIKSVGNHFVVVKLGNGFSGRIKIKVAAKA